MSSIHRSGQEERSETSTQRHASFISGSGSWRCRPEVATEAAAPRSSHRGPCLNSETRFFYKRIWVQEMGSFVKSPVPGRGRHARSPKVARKAPKVTDPYATEPRVPPSYRARESRRRRSKNPRTARQEDAPGAPKATPGSLKVD